MTEPQTHTHSGSEYAMALLISGVAGTLGGTVGGLIVLGWFDAFLNWLRTI